MASTSAACSNNESEPPAITTPLNNKRKSLVWQHFRKHIHSDSAICITCDQTLKMGKGSSTSCLANHLRKHPQVYDEFQKNQIQKRKGEEKEVKKKIKVVNSQTTLTSTMVTLSKKRSDDITQAIAGMIAYDMHTYSLASEPAFNRLIKVLEPRYEIPHRTTFSRKIIPDMYAKEKANIFDEIEKDSPGLQSMAITTDTWTSLRTESYMSLTLHYVSSKFELKRFVLSNKLVENAHTADNLLQQLEEMMDEWPLANVPIFVVSDNARNIKAAVNRSKYEGVNCFAHTLQLAINDAVKNTQGTAEFLKQARAIVSHYHHSTTAKLRLTKTQERLGLPIHSLVQDVATRWNSQYDMLERLVEQREAISADIAANPEIDNLNNAQWKMGAGLVQVLAPYKEATADLCGDKYPTLSMVIPVLYCLMKKTKDYIDLPGGSGIMFARSLVKCISSRFPLMYKNEDNFVFSMFLDPRFKLALLDEGDRQPIVLKLTEFCKKLDSVTHKSICATASLQQTSPQPKPSVWDLIDGMSGDRVLPEDPLDSEIKDYLMTSRIPRKENPLQWWSQARSRFPILSKAARYFLGTPATQASSERLFSSCSNIVTDRRACLLPNNVEVLCFLHDNSKFKMDSE